MSEGRAVPMCGPICVRLAPEPRRDLDAALLAARGGPPAESLNAISRRTGIRKSDLIRHRDERLGLSGVAQQRGVSGVRRTIRRPLARKLRPLAPRALKAKVAAHRRREQHEATGLVYFVRDGGRGPIKIGKTSDLASRVSGLQTGNPRLLELMLTIRGYTELEEYFHKRFAKFRIRASEWFRPDEEPLDFIAVAKAGGWLPGDNDPTYDQMIAVAHSDPIADGLLEFLRLAGVAA